MIENNGAPQFGQKRVIKIHAVPAMVANLECSYLLLLDCFPGKGRFVDDLIFLCLSFLNELKDYAWIHSNGQW